MNMRNRLIRKAARNDMHLEFPGSLLSLISLCLIIETLFK